MPAPGIPYGRTALPTKTVDDAAYVGLSERMSQDSFRLGASHRAEQDAQSLASLIQVPDSGGVTGTTGYEGMLQPEPETSPSTPVSDSQEFGDTTFGDTAPRRMALQAMPTMPDLLSPSPRQPLSQQQGQSVDLPGTPESAPLSISFPASGGSGASLLPGAASASPASPPSPPAGGAIDNSSRQAFVTSAWPHMLEAAGGNRDAAEMMLAAAISENGSIGTGRPIWANNFYGIKGSGDAGSVTADTHEIVDGQRVDMPDAFAAYSTPTAGFRAFFDFLEANPRYERALGAYRQTGDAAQLFRDANTAGYATDPQWAAKVESIRRNQVAPIVAGVQTPAPSATQRAAEGRALAGEARQAGTLDTAGITKAYQGVPYVFGGAGGRSDMRLGAASDCAGFVASVWKNQYGLDLAAHTDTSYNQLKALGAHDVAESDARPGDVVYYMGAGTGGAITHHMGIYAGPGKVLDMSVSGGDGVRTRDIGHAGRHVILRDPRVNPQMPKQPLTPPPIVPSADSGGAPVSRADADALSLAALSDPSTSITSDAGEADLRMAQMPTQSYSDVMVGMEPEAPAPAGPPARDDYRNDVLPPVDPDQGPRELGYSLPPAPAAAEQPGLLQGIGQGIWDAGAGAAGAVSDAAGRAVGAVQGAVVYPERSRGAVPPEQRPPQYSGPSYSQPTREQAGMAPVEPWEPIQNVGATIVDAAAASAEAADRSLTGPTLPAPTWDDPLAPVRAVGQHIVQQPLSVLPAAIYGDVQGAGADVIGRRAGAAAGLSDEKQPYETPLGTFDLSQQDLAGLAAQIGLDPMNFVGVPAAAKARGLVRALVEAVPGIGELLAVGDIATAGVRAARARVGPAIAAALDANAQRVAAADARMAAQGSTAAPGVFGLSGIEPDLPAVQGMRPRIIPPDVADSLDLPIRLPEDPSVIRAIEAAGGTVDERGTTLNVIRMSDPEAAGGAATRSMVFYTAGPPGAPSEYARTGTVGPQGVGGQQRIEGKTRFRNPLFISDAPGEAQGFDDAMTQMGLLTPENDNWRGLPMANAGPSASEVEQGIAAAKRAGPAGSPERAQALKDLVSRYGGDPDVIDDLIALRGAEMGESVYAVKENIVAGNARRAGHDGVITVQAHRGGYQDALEAAVQAHPQHQAQQAIVDDLRRQQADSFRASRDAIELGSPDAPRLREEHRALAMQSDAARRKLANIHDRLIDEVEVEVPSRITELADPREARNPTPSEPTAALKAAYRRAKDAEAGFNEASGTPYPGTPEEARALREAQAAAQRELEEANAALDALMNETETPPGYTLRPDIPRRAASTAASTQIPNPRIAEARDAYGRALAAAAGKDPSSPEVAALGRAYDEFVASQRESPFLTAPPTRGPGSEIAQASAGALAPPVTRRDPFALATRAISEPLAGSIGGATIGGGLPAESDEERRANALRGAAIGAGGFPAATRLARGAARLAGAEARGGGALATVGGLPPVPPPRGPTPPAATPGLLAQFPGVQGALQASAQRAAAMQARGLTKPSAVEWLKQLGFSGIFGPATGTGQVIGGALEVAGAQPKEALRALTTGQGGRYGSQVAEQMRALPEAWDGFWDVVLGRRGAAGTTAASGGTQQGTAKLSERVVNPLQHAAARVMEKSGEIWAEAPDAIFRPIFTAQGMRREADRIAQELGQGKAHADTLLAEAKQLHKHPGSAASPEAQRIVDAGQAYADELGYKGDPGKAASWLAKQSQRNDAVGLAASYAIPFPGMAGRTTRAALRVTPGVGLLPGVRAGRPMLGFDTIHDQAIGAVALAGMGTYAANGGITGSGPADPEERKAMIAQGWQPNSMLVPSPLGTFYVPNRLFQRFGPILNAVGEAHDAVAYGKQDQTPSQLITDAAKRIGTIVTDQTGLSGLSDIYDLLFGQAGFASQAPGTLGRAITRYTPGGGTVRAVAQGTDPEGVARAPDRWSALERQHEPGWAGSAAAFGEAVGQQLEQNIPGLRGDVPAGQDLFGRPLPNPQQGLGAVVPRTTTLRDEPIVRIYQEADVLPSSPKTELRVTSSQSVPPIPLMPAEQRLWNEKRGAVLLQAGQTILSDPTWTGAPLEARQKALQGIMDQAAKAADGQVLQAIGNDEITRRVNQAVSRKAG